MVTAAESPRRPRWLLARTIGGLRWPAVCLVCMAFELVTLWHRASSWLLGFTLVLVAYILVAGVATVIVLRRGEQWAPADRPPALTSRQARIAAAAILAGILAFVIGFALLLTPHARAAGLWMLFGGAAAIFSAAVVRARAPR